MLNAIYVKFLSKEQYDKYDITYYVWFVFSFSSFQKKKQEITLKFFKLFYNSTKLFPNVAVNY